MDLVDQVQRSKVFFLTVRISEQSQWTALMLAGYRGHEKIVGRCFLKKYSKHTHTHNAELLLANSADINAQCESGTALAISQIWDRGAVVRLLKGYYSFFKRSKY